MEPSLEIGFENPVLVLIGLICFIPIMLICICIFVPIQVVIIAARANYSPKVVHLNDQSLGPVPSATFWGFLWGFYFCKDVVPKSGTQEKSTLSFFSRIKRLEGWKSLFRSTVLSILMVSVMTVFYIASVLSLLLVRKLMSDTTTNVLDFGVPDILGLLITFPFIVIQSRAIVHPEKLNWFKFGESLKKVTSEVEYVRPWRLYTIPGAFLAVFSRWFLIRPFADLLKSIFVRGLIFMTNDPNIISPNNVWVQVLGGVLFLAWLFVMVPIVTVLDCVIVRLMTQRTGKSYWEKTSSSEIQGIDIEQVGDREPIVSLRPCFGEEHPGWNYFNSPFLEPYKGILDCARKMRDEEGWDSLRRSALISALACVGVLS